MINELLIGIVLLGLLFGACAPSSLQPPSPTSVPLAPTLIPIATPQLTTLISTEELAWQKVVDAAKKEGGLTIYSFHLYADTGIQVSRAFTQRTGLKLEVVSAQPTSLIERFNAERRTGSLVASILTGGAGDALSLKQSGKIQRLGYFPELKNESVHLYDPWIDKDGYVLSLNMIKQSPWVNTTLVTPGTEPKSWRDLLRTEWQGKIGMDDPDLATPVNYIYQALTSRKKLDDAFFRELGKQKLRFYPNPRMTAESLARGEVAMSFVSYASVAYPFLKEGVPIKAIDMAEGVVTFRGGAIVIFEGAPQPNAARVFINWLFSQQGQSVFQKYNGSSGFRKDVPSFEAPGAQFTPANPIMTDQEDQLKAEEIRKVKVVKKLLKGE